MIGELTNHLWQSTLFAVAVGVMVLAFRKNRASVRYWLWLSASLKFLVPFSVLMRLGSHLEWTPAAKNIATQAVSFTVVQITQPFPDTLSFAPAVPRSVEWLPLVILSVWVCGVGAIALMRLKAWLRIRSMVRSSSRLEIPAAVEVRSSPGLLEPGVVGLIRPVLLLPAGIADRLTPPQLEAVLAHELCHVKRRDNLTAAIHMIVEAVFWFYPLVWWIGARLVEEREAACDEDVLRLGNEPQVYAQGILNVCKFYAESPLTCISGVTGSDLKKRIERIMKAHFGQALSSRKKLFLATAGIVALATPIIAGVLVLPGHALNQIFGAKAEKMSFEVASVKLSKSPGRPTGNVPLDVDETFVPTGGLFSVTNTPLFVLLRFAYKSTLSTPGLPPWGRTDRFDIEAKAQGNPTKDQFRLMMQFLLADRFKLVMHAETKQSPIYALIMAKPGKNGPQLRPDEGPCVTTADDLKAGGAASELPAAAQSASAALQIPAIPCGVLIPVPPSAPGRIRIAGRKVTLELLAMMAASPASGVDRPVFDRTGLTGKFDMSFEFAPRPNSVTGPPPPGFTPDEAGPTFFEALQDALGLKLEPQTGPVDFLVIDHVEEPSAN